MPEHAEDLIKDLLDDPGRFKRKGRAYQLLEEYFDGRPLTSLIPLLRHEDSLVQHAAIFVASELGERAAELVDEVLPLVRSTDRYVKYNALEVLMACSAGGSEGFVEVALALTDDDEVIRGLAMRFVANANQAQLQSALRSLRGGGGPHAHEHISGLETLLSCESVPVADIVRMIESDSSLRRKYGAIAWRRRGTPQEAQLPAQLHADPDLTKFLSDG